ncbi:hypothetical protein GCM10017788_08260 [Amycolatopsis acidiphila]|nr:hypothetical protein GCM10017788_08260 [Amycolatopsis acidiphila]
MIARMCAARGHGEQMERLTLGGLTDLGKVREAVRKLLLDCAQDDVIDAVLVADELGTLACEYGNLPAAISVIRSYGQPSLRVAVNAAHLSLPTSTSRSRTTRHLLEACAMDWGIGNEGVQMILWACVALPSAQAGEDGDHDGFPAPRMFQS